MTDTSKYTEAFRCEYEATRSLDRAVAAVVTAVKAQLELPLPAPARPVQLKVVVVHRYSRPAPEARGPETLVAKVRRLAAAEFGVKPRDLAVSRSARGSRWHTNARWTVIGVFRELGMTLPACAQAACMADHASVIYALKGIAARAYLRAAIARVKAAALAEQESAPPAAEAA